ncbi:MAG: DUF1329 domain-containing protein [Gammaproteobacteria bacterium]|nr:DUF1329 domain-containing protein [Gammaproteobacteria bacterium]
MSKLAFCALGGALMLTAAGAGAFTKEDVENSFYPYKTWTPEAPGYTAGMVINQGNADQFKDILDPAMYDHVKRGWVELQTRAAESLELHPNYIKATFDAVANQPTLTGDGLVENFVAGRAFPFEPDPNDPQAGLKLAWNYQYGYNWGDNAAICPFYWKYRDAKSEKLERTVKFCFHFLNWMHRVNQDPVPQFADNPSKLFRSIYVIAYEPFDLNNTQLLIHRYKDDHKRDDAWLYLGFQRRVRRLATGQVTDSFLGADPTIEDFEGYNARISDYQWKYIETKNALLPFHRHNELALATDMPPEPDGYQYVDFGGYGQCFPKSTWELRKVYVLEGIPEDPNHPVSKRVLFVDAQTFTIPRSGMFDRKGDLWRSFTICQAQPDYHHASNKGSGVSIDDCFMMMNVQQEHCTTGQFKGLVDPALNPPSLFTVQNLRKSGR